MSRALSEDFLTRHACVVLQPRSECGEVAGLVPARRPGSGHTVSLCAAREPGGQARSVCAGPLKTARRAPQWLGHSLLHYARAAAPQIGVSPESHFVPWSPRCHRATRPC